MRKPAICLCENKDTDQLRGNREVDQCLCFRHMDSAIPLLSKSEISSLQPSSMAAQPGLCGSWSETPKTGFLTTRLIFFASLLIHVHVCVTWCTTLGYISPSLTANRIWTSLVKQKWCPWNCKLQFHGHHLDFRKKDFQMLLEVKKGHI